MSRTKPDPQDRKVQLNASIKLRVKDRLEEEHELTGQSESAIVEKALMQHFGMQ